MAANALWGWLELWKKTYWQHKGKATWAAELWQDITAWVEKLAVKACHVGAHIPRSQAIEEHHNNRQVHWAAKNEVSQVDVDWQHRLNCSCLSGPMIRKEMQHTDGLVIGKWTSPWLMSMELQQMHQL